MVDDGAWRDGGTSDGHEPRRSEAVGTRGVVSSAHPVAAFIGLSVLQRGGNAFDAAIATAAAEGVLLPAACGLGGDAFVVLFDARHRENVAINGSGVAGSHATRERYTGRGLEKMPLEGVHSVSVPGAVSLYETLWKRYCSMSWTELWEPAVGLAEGGLAINERIAKRLAEHSEQLGRHRYSARQFLPSGRAPRPGERWSAPDLARSLREVAEGGADSFYRGPLAAKMLDFLKAEGAPFESDDFASQEAVVYEPLMTEYRGHTVCETAPPSQGFLLLEQLNILEGFDLAQLDPAGADRIHYLVEAKKLAFADRNRYAGDPAFVDWPLEALISKEHAAQRRREIDLRRASLLGAALVAEHSGDTSYFAITDSDGNAVSFIHSLSAAFGSAVVAGETGILLNNRAGRGFRLEEGHPNVIAPGKRTMHTLNAYMVCRDDKPWLVGGTPGGDQQTQVNSQVLTNLIDHGMGLQEAINAPRWFSFPGTDPATVAQPMEIRIEARVPLATRRELESRGHAIKVLEGWGGGGAVQLVALDRDTGVIRGASDPRAGGVALGL